MGKRRCSWQILSGTLLLVAALCLWLWGVLDEQRAVRSAAEALDALDEQLPARMSPSVPLEPPAPSVPAPEEPIPVEPQPLPAEMPVVSAEGMDYVAVLEIPALELELPVINRWSKEALRVAPCRYMGSAYDGDLIIAGHNYGKHFGGLHELAEGQRIYLTDMAENRFTYQVIAVEQLAGTAVEEMEQGEWDLTLFTCTIGGKNRVTVRCEQLDPPQVQE